MLRLTGLPIWVAMLIVQLAAGCGGGGGGGGGTTQPVISAATPPAGSTGVAYPAFTFSVASGGLAPFTWSETGALSAGMSLSPNGQLTGTPVTAGIYPITVMVTDSSTPALTGTLHVSLVIQDSSIVVATTPAPPAGARLNPYPAYSFQVASGGSPGFTWAITAGALPPGLALASGGTLTGIPTMNGTFQFTATATDSAVPAGKGSAQFSIMVSDAVAGAGAFTLTGSMRLPRSGHTATLLIDGKVLVAGGPFSSAELYDPGSGTFSDTGPMSLPRSGHAAALLKLTDATLPNYGKVLIAGGNASTMAELYDPTTGTFSPTTHNMISSRPAATATLLNTNKALLTGGTTAELYDPASDTFTKTIGDPSVSRDGYTATLLISGKVLIAGGHTPVEFETATAELYDPISDTFTATGSMTQRRAWHTATLLNDNPASPDYGKVLVVGTDGSADLYDPESGTFAAAGSLSPTNEVSLPRTASLRADGTVLIAGGSISEHTMGQIPGLGCMPIIRPVSVHDAALYSQESAGFAITGPLNVARDQHTATVLADGTVLIAGGQQHTITGDAALCTGRGVTATLSSAELFK